MHLLDKCITITLLRATLRPCHNINYNDILCNTVYFKYVCWLNPHTCTFLARSQVLHPQSSPPAAGAVVLQDSASWH